MAPVFFWGGLCIGLRETGVMWPVCHEKHPDQQVVKTLEEHAALQDRKAGRLRAPRLVA